MSDPVNSPAHYGGDEWCPRESRTTMTRHHSSPPSTRYGIAGLCWSWKATHPKAVECKHATYPRVDQRHSWDGLSSASDSHQTQTGQ